jgi:hypothetical protein
MAAVVAGALIVAATTAQQIANPPIANPAMAQYPAA